VHGYNYILNNSWELGDTPPRPPTAGHDILGNRDPQYDKSWYELSRSRAGHLVVRLIDIITFYLISLIDDLYI
jgi:hypothetical protein